MRRHFTYANVMSSIAVFMILGGATAMAAKVGTGQLKAGSVKTGKIAKEAVKSGKIAKNAIIESKLADGAVTTNKIADNAVTGAKVNEASLGEVPTAANAVKLDGQSPSSFVARNTLLWAIVNENGNLVASSGATGSAQLGTGDFRVTFNRVVTNCASEGSATDISGGAAPAGGSARIVGTDNREQAADNTVDVTLTDPAGAVANPAGGDGFVVTLYC